MCDACISVRRDYPNESVRLTPYQANSKCFHGIFSIFQDNPFFCKKQFLFSVDKEFFSSFSFLSLKLHETAPQVFCILCPYLRRTCSQDSGVFLFSFPKLHVFAFFRKKIRSLFQNIFFLFRAAHKTPSPTVFAENFSASCRPMRLMHAAGPSISLPPLSSVTER